MLSSTWYQHLVLPIVENPHTVTSQQLEFMGDLANHTYDDPVTRGSHFGITTDKFFFGYESVRFKGKPYQESAHPIAPYEMPFAPGALFAIRKDEFWRLGGYDKGLYVWGGENMELSLKIWLCGGRLVQVPCSSTGHMYRIRDVHKWTNDNFTELAVKLGVDGNDEGKYLAYGVARNVDVMTRIWLRNNIRVAKIWLGEWRKYYYKEVFGSKELPGGWAKFEEDDEYIKEQLGFKEKNHCRDFDWLDKHVYMRILGIHNPWYAARQMDLNANATLNASNPKIIDSQHQLNLTTEL
jgi:polypeptide N-acetylgalactosaminyltransferase